MAKIRPNGVKFARSVGTAPASYFSTQTAEVVTDGLRVHFNALDYNSYPGYGTTWYDISGNSYDATIHGSCTYTGTGISTGTTDNTTNYISFPSDEWNGITEWTLEFMLTRRAAQDTLEAIIHAGQDGTNTNYGLITLSNNSIDVYNGLAWDSYESVSQPLGLDTKYHIVLRSNSNDTFDIFVNNTNIATIDNTNVGTALTKVSTVGIILGQEMDSTTGGFQSFQCFLGEYHSFRMYNRALTNSEVTQNYNADYSAVRVDRPVPDTDYVVDNSLRVAFDAQTSFVPETTLWADMSGNDYHATIHGSCVYTEDGVDTGLSANTTNYVSFPVDPFNGVTEFTMEWIVTREAETTYNPIMSGGDSGGINKMLCAMNGTNFVFSMNGTTPGAKNAGIVNGTTYHLVATRGSDLSTVSYYANGVLIGTGTSASVIAPTSTIGMIMGQEMDNDSGGFVSSQSFLGKFHAFRLYDRELSAGELTTNYNDAVTRYGV